MPNAQDPTPNNLGDVPDATNAQSLADDLGAIALVRSGEWGVGSRRRGNAAVVR